MKCKCRDCKEEFDNGSKFETSVCPTCFIRFNQDLLQPLKERLRVLLDKTVVDQEKFEDGLVGLGYHQRWVKEIMGILGKTIRENEDGKD